jgi:hypothetical protein
MRSWRTLRRIFIGSHSLPPPLSGCLIGPSSGKLIGTKWVWKNKEGEKGEVVRNKSRLVAQGFSQKERIDYEETVGDSPRGPL